MSLPIITVPFDPKLHEAFVERLEKAKNYNALNLLAGKQEGFGYKCPVCEEIKPYYSYNQSRATRSGLKLHKCSECIKEATNNTKNVKSFF